MRGRGTYHYDFEKLPSRSIENFVVVDVPLREPPRCSRAYPQSRLRVEEVNVVSANAQAYVLTTQRTRVSRRLRDHDAIAFGSDTDHVAARTEVFYDNYLRPETFAGQLEVL